MSGAFTFTEADLRPRVIINVVMTFLEMISFNPHIKRRAKCIPHLVNNAIQIPVLFFVK